MTGDTTMREREAAGHPNCVGMVGASATGRAVVLQLGRPAPGVRLVAIANQKPSKKLSITFSVTFLLVLLFLPGAKAIAGAYTTYFPLTENPISEGGRWINGKTVGLDWANVSTTPGLAIGTESGSGGYDDSTALLTGTWGADQWAQATVYTVSQNRGDIFEEVEIRLRSSLSAHSCTGYEILFRALKPDGYVTIVRWNGPLGDFTYLSMVNYPYPGITTGDVVKAAIAGDVITAFVNGVVVARATDNRFSTGNPGIGFWLKGPTGISLSRVSWRLRQLMIWLQGATGINGHFGLTSFTASDAADTSIRSSSQNPRTVP